MFCFDRYHKGLTCDETLLKSKCQFMKPTWPI